LVQVVVGDVVQENLLPGVLIFNDFTGNFYRLDTGSGALTLLGNNGLAQMGMTSVPSSMPGRGSAPALMLLLD